MDSQQVKSTPEPVPTSSKISIPFLCILAVFFAAGMVGFVLNSFKPKQVAQNTQVSVDEMGNWKTYRNKEYGFELKVPNDWITEELSADFISIRLKSDKDVVFGKMNYGPVSPISILIHENAENKDVSTWFNGAYDKGEIFSQKTIKINNYNAVEASVVGESSTLSTYLGLDKHVLEIYIDNSSSYKNIYNQILSTFKFIEPTATTTSNIVTPKLWTGAKWQEVADYNNNYKNNGFNYYYENTDPKADIKNTYPNPVFPSGKLWKTTVTVNTNTELANIENGFRKYYEDFRNINAWAWEQKISNKQMRITGPSADGVTGSVWGYIKVLDNKLKLLGLGYNLTSYTDNSTDGPIEIACPCDLELKVFVSDDVDLNTLKF